MITETIEHDVPSPPVVKVEEPITRTKHRLGTGWTDSWLAPSGGEAQRRVRRARERGQAKALRKVNRRRFRAWNSQRMATSTLIQQVRIYDGKIGNDLQRARVTKMFNQQAQALGQPVDEVLDALRTGLGLAG